MRVELVEVIEYTQNKRGYTQNLPFSVLSFRLQGQSHLISATQSVEATAGDLLMAPKGSSYEHIGKEEKLIAFHFNCIDTPLDAIRVFTPKSPEFYRDLFSEALCRWRQKEVGYHHRVLSLFYRILSEMEQEGIILSSEADPTMAQCREYINAHLEDLSLSVAFLAEKYHMSETYFRRRFKKRNGIAPKDYIIQKRMKYAEILLRIGHLSHREIAETCGYSDVKFFREAFRRYFGTSITKYIKQKTNPLLQK